MRPVLPTVLCAGLLALATMSRALPPPPAPIRLEETIRDVVAKAAPAVVRVEVEREDPALDDPRRRLFAPLESERRGEAGSGTVLRADGLVLTHRSIVARASAGARILVATESGRRLGARVLGIDPELDVALLQAEVEGDPLPALAPGSAVGLSPGRLVLTLGHPFGVARDASASASLGIVEATGRLDAPELVYGGDVIVTDGAVNPGSEGGALLDLEGRLVGILVPIVRDRRCDALKGVAVPIDAIVPRLDLLARGGPPGRLGIVCAPSERDPAGLTVRRVVPGSGAERAGVREGDRLVQLDDQPIDGVAALLRVVERRPAGSVMKAVIERDGKRLEVSLRLGD